MSGNLFDRYGAITHEDVFVLEVCLTQLCTSKHKIRVVEIGMHDGGTARGIEQFCKEMRTELEYWGIDPDDGTSRPRHMPPGGTFVHGDSSEVYMKIPDGIDLLWVDGCHCVNHVILDTLHYVPKLAHGGFVCYHDANEAGQGMHHQYHGPDHPDFGLGITKALSIIGFPLRWNGIHPFKEKFPADRTDCGTISFRRS